MTNRFCTVPITDVLTAPYNLAWGSSIYAKVTATNAYGTSAASDVGNGAVILTNPDPPAGVGFNAALSSASFITVTWQ